MNKKTLLAVIALVAVIACMAAIFIFARPQAQQGSKQITVTVIHADKTERTFSYYTDEAYLDKVLIAEKLIEGYEDQYGFVIEKVDGEVADWHDNVFWALYVGEEQSAYGVSGTVVTDGASYKLVYESFT